LSIRLFSDDEHAVPYRRAEPFVKARHEDVAVELPEADRHLGEALCPVDHGDNVVRARQGAQALDRQNPTVPMVHVRQLHHPRARRDRPGIGRDDRLAVIEETELAGDRFDALALLALQPAGAHAGIVPG